MKDLAGRQHSFTTFVEDNASLRNGMKNRGLTEERWLVLLKGGAAFPTVSGHLMGPDSRSQHQHQSLFQEERDPRREQIPNVSLQVGSWICRGCSITFCCYTCFLVWCMEKSTLFFFCLVHASHEEATWFPWQEKANVAEQFTTKSLVVLLLEKEKQDVIFCLDHVYCLCCVHG